MRNHESYIPDEVNRNFIPRPESETRTIPLEELSKEYDELNSSPSLSPEMVAVLCRKLRVQLTNEIILKHGEGLTVEQLKTIKNEKYRTIVDEIVNNALEQLGEIGDFRIRKLGEELLNKPDTGLVKFFEKFFPNIYNRLTLPQGALGTYNASKEKIWIAESNPEEGILKDLATSGDSTFASTLHHEVTHYHQLDRKKSFRIHAISFFKFLLLWGGVQTITMLHPGAGITSASIIWPVFVKKHINEYKKRRLIMETQASLAQNQHSQEPFFTEQEKEDGFESFLEHLAEEYGIKGREKILSLIDTIRKLYAMDISDETIATLSMNDDWDSKKKRFTDLSKTVDTLRKTCGYSTEQLDELVKADDLRRDIFLERFKRIAQIALIKAVETNHLEEPSEKF